jgi:DNA-binding SARP family transcriptional activator
MSATTSSVPIGQVGGPPHVDVRLFGGFGLTIDGVDVDLTRVRPRAQTLLRLLALHCGKDVSRDWLCETFWPDMSPERAAHNLQVDIAALRVALQPSVRGRASEILVRRGTFYRLVADSDVREFDALWVVLRAELLLSDSGPAHLDPSVPDERAVTPARLVALQSGGLLPDDDADWVGEARDRYAMQAAEAAVLLAERALARGDTAVAIRAAEAATAADPWHDASWRLLISSHEAAGNWAAVVRAQRQYAHVLAELDVEAVARPEPVVWRPATAGSSRHSVLVA